MTHRITAGVVIGLWLFTAAGQGAAQTCKVPSFAAPRSLIAVPPLDGRQIGFAAVAKGDFNGDGKLDIAAVRLDDSGDQVSVFLNTGAGNFSGPTDYTAGPGATAIAVSDFNRDGKLDLAVTVNGFPADCPSLPCHINNQVAILLGDGQGGFGTPTFVSFDAGTTGLVGVAAGIAAGDLNGDGKVDLAVANTSNDSVSVLFGKGDGTFASAAAYPVGANPTAVVIGNFDGDKKPDLVTANWGYNGANNTISLLLNTGAGGFAPRTDIAVGNGPYALTEGDFNKDGKLDLAVVLGGPSLSTGTVAVLLGDGAGFFTSITDFPEGGVQLGSGSDAIAAADFNGDKKLDLAVTNLNDGTVAIMLGDGTGSFAAPTAFGVGSSPNSIAVGDFNKDGKQDLAVGSEGYGNIAILPGDGTGKFGSGRDVDLGPDVQPNVNPNSFASTVLQDITGDGKLDLVTTAGVIFKTNPDGSLFFSSASAAVGKGTGRFAPPMPISSQDPNLNMAVWLSFAIADLNKLKLYTLMNVIRQQAAISPPSVLRAEPCV